MYRGAFFLVAEKRLAASSLLAVALALLLFVPLGLLADLWLLAVGCRQLVTCF